MLGGEQGELAAQRFGTVHGDEGLVTTALIGAQGSLRLPLTGGGQQRSDRALPEERQIGG